MKITYDVKNESWGGDEAIVGIGYQLSDTHAWHYVSLAPTVAEHLLADLDGNFRKAIREAIGQTIKAKRERIAIANLHLADMHKELAAMEAAA